MNSNHNPETMTADERRAEVASLLARGLLGDLVSFVARFQHVVVGTATCEHCGCKRSQCGSAQTLRERFLGNCPADSTVAILEWMD